MELTDREKDLITSALHILETACIGDELHPDTADDLGGTPDDEEVRSLMDKIDKEIKDEERG